MKTPHTYILLLFVCLHAASCKQPTNTIRPKPATEDKQKLKLKQHIAAIKQYAKQQHGSDKYAVLIDMSINSWKKRFFVVNLKTDSVIISGLCGHGQGSNYMKEEVEFSNVVGSNCTSQGHYRIGYKYFGDFGDAYKLYGLDSTNSNAFRRFVVFHSYSCVPDFEGSPACRSNGCAMVSPYTFKATDKVLSTQQKPVIMWIYK